MLALAATATVLSVQRSTDSFHDVALLALYPALTIALLWLRGSYVPHLTPHLLDELRTLVFTTALSAMCMFAIRALLYDESRLAGEGIRNWLFALLFLSAGRLCYVWVERRAWKKGHHQTRTLIIGAGTIGRLVAKRLVEHPEWGFQPVGFLDRNPSDAGTGDAGHHLPVLGASWDIDRVVKEHRVSFVIVAFSTAPHEVFLRIVKRCAELRLTVSIVPRLFEQVTGRLTVEHVGGLPLLTSSHSDPRGWRFATKYAVDRVLAVIGLLLGSAFIAVGAAAVYLSMGRPVIYRQLRVGLDGKPFYLLKLRTMRDEENPAPMLPDQVHESDGDRLTPVGRFLRATSIDELPQFVNVLRGDMSIVGPRPERPEFAAVFQDNVYRYGERHRVKSGITGWAQVHGIGRGSNRFSPSCLADRVEWDNYYIENWSLWLDVKILLMTVAATIHFRQA